MMLFPKPIILYYKSKNRNIELRNDESYDQRHKLIHSDEDSSGSIDTHHEPLSELFVH